MSLRKSKLIFILVVFSSFGLYQVIKPQPLVQKKLTHLNVSQFSSRGIVNRVIQLKIDVANESEVTSSVSLPFDFDDSLQYKWILGEGVELIEGSLVGSTERGFKKDQPVKIKVKVKGFDAKSNHHIGFEVSGVKNNHRLYADGLISSQFEKSFEKTVQKVERMKAENSGINK